MIVILINSFSQDYNDQLWIMYGASIFNIILYLLISWILIFRTERILRIIRVNTDNQQLNLNIGKTDVLEIATIIIAIMAIIFAIPSVLHDLIYFIDLQNVNSFSMIVQLIVGVILLLKARMISAWVIKRGIANEDERLKTTHNNGEHEEPL